MVNVLSNTNSVISNIIAELRDVDVQKDNLRFRANLEKMGAIFAYEISKSLTYQTREVITSLGIANVPVLAEYPVLATILRAGLPFHQGFLNIFDKSENAFISAYRKTHKDHSFSIQVEYSSCPDLTGKTVILSDTMIATGSLVLMTYKELLTHGKPAQIHIATVLASLEGIDYLKKHLPQHGIKLWIGAIDDELTAQSYIVPGLGDAGDLAFGKKG
ncbi:MAG: uracil phosphoribosyltransferase [Bacteroidota bacterium]